MVYRALDTFRIVGTSEVIQKRASRRCGLRHSMARHTSPKPTSGPPWFVGGSISELLVIRSDVLADEMYEMPISLMWFLWTAMTATDRESATSVVSRLFTLTGAGTASRSFSGILC